jgi:hypothetical protein
MTDATQLPLEVAEAMEWFEARQRFGVNGRKCAAVIRAELLRLTEENGQQSSYIEALTQRCVEDTDALGKAEAERNALRARIESAPIVVARDVTGNPDIDVIVSHTLAGKRVRLVLEADQ